MRAALQLRPPMHRSWRDFGVGGVGLHEVGGPWIRPTRFWSIAMDASGSSIHRSMVPRLCRELSVAGSLGPKVRLRTSKICLRSPARLGNLLEKLEERGGQVGHRCSCCPRSRPHLGFGIDRPLLGEPDGTLGGSRDFGAYTRANPWPAMSTGHRAPMHECEQPARAQNEVKPQHVDQVARGRILEAPRREACLDCPHPAGRRSDVATSLLSGSRFIESTRAFQEPSATSRLACTVVAESGPP